MGWEPLVKPKSPKNPLFSAFLAERGIPPQPAGAIGSRAVASRALG
jgi:hypothetical protein